MTNRDYSEQANLNRQEGDIQKSPLLIMLVLFICTLVMVVLFTGITKAYEQPKPKAVEKEAETWQPPVPETVKPDPLVSKERARRIAKKWGVELISLRLTAAGYMIDFRFRVLDIEKAQVFFDHRVKPLLEVERSHAKLPVPMAAKVGAFRTTNRGKNIKPDKIYYMVFANPDAHVKSGEKVTMVIGHFKAKHLAVN
jgi:hypothetical protein